MAIERRRSAGVARTMTARFHDALLGNGDGGVCRLLEPVTRNRRERDRRFQISLQPVANFDRVGETWMELQERADGSFFQSWAWTGCLAEERFPRPVVLEAREGANLVAMGLFNMRAEPFGRSMLCLGESGVADLDALCIEHNGFLVGQRGAPSLLAQCLRTAQSAPIGGARPHRDRTLVLSGVAADHLAAARSLPGIIRLRAVDPAPFVDLRGIRQSGRDFLASVSANMRYQLRRSKRHYASLGSLVIRRARSRIEATDFLSRLAGLHQVYWTSRGKPGAFANPAVVRFHRALIDSAFDSGAIDLLEVVAGEQILGYLYNFQHRGRVYAYQSGFDYALPHRHCKPGLTCHHLAIEMYLGEGGDAYHFLAGRDRYKENLANAAATLYWIAIHPTWSTAGLLAAAKNWYCDFYRTDSRSDSFSSRLPY
jgi:CelD/BcsL family acetyltransferase involved in cellulose biosynthesis